MMKQLKIVICAAFASLFPSLCAMFSLVCNQQSTCEFSRPQNSVQNLEIQTAGSGGLLSDCRY